MSKLRVALPELRKQYQLKDLYLFGSVARGDDRAESDVDILMEFEPDARPTLGTFGCIMDDLEKLLGRKVDVVENHPGLRPVFRQLIEQDKLRVA